MKDSIYIFVLVLLSSCSISNKHHQIPCELVEVNNRNVNEDTSKIYLFRFALADTTRYLHYGFVYDRKTYKPLENAILTLNIGGDKYSDTTKSNGQFKFEGFFGQETKFCINITHKKYKCLTITYNTNSNFLGSNFKLEKQ